MTRRHSRAWHDMHDAALAAGLRGPRMRLLTVEQARAQLYPEASAGMVLGPVRTLCGNLAEMFGHAEEVNPGAPVQPELDLARSDRHAARHGHYLQTGDLE